MPASLNLPGEAGGYLAARAALLDGTYREGAGRVTDNVQVVFDGGRLHFAAMEPEPEPASSGTGVYEACRIRYRARVRSLRRRALGSRRGDRPQSVSLWART
ncbi:transposase, tnpA family protein [Streptomyces laurentii]|uniref:Transposase, tnpA family protein n=1 Tax=Streptomyces laurentii TaxID=39478 RepID=A0A170RUF3_STRLU|nr:transposase, tnpA family protein [Streptomyces laurentii]